MKHRILGLLGGRRRRSLIAGTLAVLAAGAFALSALAVHDEVFQLDGDVIASTTTTVGGTTQTLDWDSFFDADGGEKALPAGFTASSFDRDFLTNADGSFNTADTTTFATGSKDTLGISPGWQCSFSNNVNSKIDVMNAYAAAYTAPNGDELLYFALEKNANEGNNNVGFWFLQDETSCAAASGNNPFVGDHTDGDLLIVSAFTNGGVVSTINVYRWSGDDAGCIDNPDVAATCDGQPVASGADCTTEPAGDDACATVNAPNDGVGGTITTPWLTANKDDGAGHSLRTAEFFEGGVNLTDNDLGGKCFTTFLADTRSSQSLTATLFDFSSGQLGECAATMTTQVSTEGPVTPGTAVTDTATVVGNKPLLTPSGDVTFFLCGPIATGACETGGTNIGTGTLSGTGATASATSPTVNVSPALAPGRYCFRAEWPGDLNYTTPLSHFGGPTGTNECFTVSKLDTQTVTTPVDGSGVETHEITLTQSIRDKAVVTGTAAGGDPTGEVNFFVCGPIASPATCNTGGTAVAGNPVTLVSDGNAATFTSSATSGAFTPTEVGRYCFRAEYGGSAIYNPSSDSGANECFTVTDTTATATHQVWLPNDEATITSANGAPISGTLSFTLHAGGDCTGEVLRPAETFTLDNAASPVNRETTNQTVTVEETATVSWEVVFTSSNPFVSGSSRCETTSLEITN
jgi:hypothetical protein